jgi:(2R)-3-sulfolactate dehydrogenase (NADP+)
VTGQKGARMPNSRREANMRRLMKEGLPIDRALLDRLQRYCA